MAPSLTSEVAAGQNDKINYKIRSFGAMGGNCSVQSSSDLTPLLWILACWGYIHVHDNETKDKYLFQVFTANSDRGTIVSHKLSPRISTRYVRFSVLSWHGHICMRVELYGCANEPWPFPGIFNQMTIEKTRFSRNPYFTYVSDRLLNRIVRLL